MKDKPPFNRPRKVTLTEWKIVKNYTSSRIQGFICQDNKITFSNNILHEFFRVEWSFKAVVPILFGTRDWFHGRQYFHGLGGRRGGEWGRGDCVRMIQVHYIYCVLHLYHYYISSTSDHQALDSKGWGPLI